MAQQLFSEGKKRRGSTGMNKEHAVFFRKIIFLEQVQETDHGLAGINRVQHHSFFSEDGFYGFGYVFCDTTVARPEVFIK